MPHDHLNISVYDPREPAVVEYARIDDWTPVAECMPHEGQKCLVYGPGDEKHHELTAVMTWTAFKGWWPGNGERVTHWQPCPPPPRG